LDQGTGTHGTRFQAHQQGAAIKSPVAAQAGRLAKGHQFGVSKGIAVLLAPIAAPADAASPFIEHHSGDGNFALVSGPLCVAQQQLHPLALQLGPWWAHELGRIHCLLPAAQTHL
jgi:hypothetical protein